MNYTLMQTTLGKQAKEQRIHLLEVDDLLGHLRPHLRLSVLHLLLAAQAQSGIQK